MDERRKIRFRFNRKFLYSRNLLSPNNPSRPIAQIIHQHINRRQHEQRDNGRKNQVADLNFHLHFLIASLSDIFSLGVIVYEMATGNRAFLGDSLATISNCILSQMPYGHARRA